MSDYDDIEDCGHLDMQSNNFYSDP